MKGISTLARFGAVIICFCAVAATMSNTGKVPTFRLYQASDDVKNVILGLVTTANDPTININNIFNCGFGDVADDLESTLVDLINEAASCDSSRASDIEAKFQAFLDRIPATLNACVKKNFDAQELWKDLHLSGLSQDLIKNKIITYIQDNPLTTCSDLQSFQSDIQASNWNQFGKDIGSFIISIFTSSGQQRELNQAANVIQSSIFALPINEKPAVDAMKSAMTNIDALKSVLKTESSDVKTSVQKCLDEQTAKKILNEVKFVISVASSCDATKTTELIGRMLDLIEIIPNLQLQSFKTPLSSEQLLGNLGLYDHSVDDLSYLIPKFANYNLRHSSHICNRLKVLQQDIIRSDWDQFGKGLAKILAEILSYKKQQ